MGTYGSGEGFEARSQDSGLWWEDDILKIILCRVTNEELG